MPVPGSGTFSRVSTWEQEQERRPDSDGGRLVLGTRDVDGAGKGALPLLGVVELAQLNSSAS